MKTVVSIETQIMTGDYLGVAKGLSHSDYLNAKEYVSNSGMAHLLRSPAHFQAYLKEERETTKAMNMGSAVHLAILERALDRLAVTPLPEQYPNALKTGDDLKARCKELGLPMSGTKAELAARIREKDSGLILWDELLAKFGLENAGKMIVTADEMASLIGMSKAVHVHPEASVTLAGGEAEVSIFWKDPETGVKCKARLDYIKTKTEELDDFKTTEDASADAFARSALKYGYFRQGAFYSDGVEAVYGFKPAFKIDAVEKSAPYGVNVFKPTTAALEQGRQEYKKALRIYAECQDSGEWPSYFAGVQLLDMPAYGWGG
jgi:hypothetical protein